MLVAESKTQEKKKPLYDVVAGHIRGRILAGSLKPNSKIEPESELCKRFGISRGPVRQAMNSLVNEQLIYRVVGKGTFVKDEVEKKTQDVATRCIKVVIDGSDDWASHHSFFTEIIDAIKNSSFIEEKGYRLVFEFHPFSQMRNGNEKYLFQNGEFAGILFLPLTVHGVEFASSIKDTNVPVVSFFRRLNTQNISYFYIDQVAGAEQATDYLAIYGHKRIGIILGLCNNLTLVNEKRLAGYRTAMRKRSLPLRPELELSVKFGFDVFDKIYEFLKNTPERPSALLVGAKSLMMPCCLAIQKAGLRIPDDISVIAFDDSIEDREYNPPLSVIRQPIAEGIMAAMKKLLAHIENKTEKQVAQPLFPELVIRQSCLEFRGDK